VARISISTGKSLIEVIGERYRQTPAIPLSAAFIILFGCVAYQAGNVTGTAIPLLDLTGLDVSLLAALISVLAAVVLYTGKIKRIARMLGVIVVMMGIGFVYLATNAIQVSHSKPVQSDGSILLVLALVGTTIVPYNLFLGSRVAKEQTEIRLMRIGLTTSILVGGLISIAILFSGSLLPDDLSLNEFASYYGKEYGSAAAILFGIGLCSAGFTSSVTSPLAAAVTIQSTFPQKQNLHLTTWITVIVLGALFAILGGSPTFVIVTAQAINGFFLPAIVWILAAVINDKSIVPSTNGIWANVLLLLVFLISCNLGLLNLVKAAARALALEIPNSYLVGIMGFSVILTIILARQILKLK
jgi:Mn2+/Fe2+ NRAMP family transporter